MSYTAQKDILDKCRELKIPEPELEYKFHDVRKWRFDLAWPDQKVAVEIEGGVYVRGRHNRPSGFMADMEKYNAATLFGWKLLRFTPRQVEMDEDRCIAMIRDLLSV